jgi:hypothetical protein
MYALLPEDRFAELYIMEVNLNVPGEGPVAPGLRSASGSALAPRRRKPKPQSLASSRWRGSVFVPMSRVISLTNATLTSLMSWSTLARPRRRREGCMRPRVEQPQPTE